MIIADTYCDYNDNPHTLDHFADDIEIFSEDWKSSEKLQNQRSYAAALVLEGIDLCGLV